MVKRLTGRVMLPAISVSLSEEPKGLPAWVQCKRTSMCSSQNTDSNMTHKTFASTPQRVIERHVEGSRDGGWEAGRKGRGTKKQVDTFASIQAIDQQLYLAPVSGLGRSCRRRVSVF